MRMYNENTTKNNRQLSENKKSNSFFFVFFKVGCKMRAQFPFYKSFDDVIEDLTDEQLVKYMRTLLDVQFLRIKINDVNFKDKTLSIVWKSQKHSIEKSIKGFLDGQKRETIKNPYWGVYDKSHTPNEGIREGIQTPPKAEVQGEEEVQQGNGNKKDFFENTLFSAAEAKELLSYRASIRKSLKTPQAVTRLSNKFAECYKAGYTFEQVLNLMKEHQWQSIELKWLENIQTSADEQKFYYE